MPTTPIPISALPDAPDRADRATFSARAVAMFTALKNVFVGEVNAIAVTANTNAAEAAASAVASSASEYNAGVSAANAATASGAPMWVSGTTYALGAAAWSPASRMIYRRIVAGAGTTDPSADPTNWAVLGTAALAVVLVSATSQTAVVGGHYVLTNVAATTVTLPASPASGATVAITPANSLLTNVIARNGQTIMGLAENMTLDNANATVTLRFLGSTWRII